MNIESLITDLAFILLLGAGVTVLFKWIKQPIVLGYIVAGFLASPHFEYLPSVANEANIEFWAQIGIVILLFSLGLEFSFRKLMNVGGSAVVTALVIIAGMMCTGVAVGHVMGMSTINCLFLGGMLSMSSTTIIIKAFTDLGLRQKKFASLVFAVLVVEDLFAVLMMVILSSIAINNSVGGVEMIFSISKLVFFLVIWFLVGVFLLPTVLNATRRFLNSETLLVVSMGLCLGMAVFSVVCGFSLALGAFVMGSILAGTSYAERIEHVVAPVKDLFGAVFFISVGMMVQPLIIAEYWSPILILSAVVIVGMILFGSFGMLITGQTLKVAMQAGFSLTQIGEFSFIIASLGLSLGVLDATMYPIVVAVSVITTFFTPYFIKLSGPAYRFVEKHLPQRLHFLIDRYSKDVASENASGGRSHWASMLRRYLWTSLLYTIVLMAIVIVAHNFLLPWLHEFIPQWSRIATAGITLAGMSPFLIALASPVKADAESDRQKGILVNLPRIVLSIFRFLLALLFVVMVLSWAFSMAVGLIFGLAAILLTGLILSKRMQSNINTIETKFMANLNERELRRTGRGNALVSDLHLAYMTVGYACPFVGERIRNSGLRKRYGVSIVNITRGSEVIAMPSAETRIFPGDVIGVVGTDEQLAELLPNVEANRTDAQTAAPDRFKLTQLRLTESSPLIGLNTAQADVRNAYEALVISIQRNDDYLQPTADVMFAPGDIVWIVGDTSKLQKLK